MKTWSLLSAMQKSTLHPSNGVLNMFAYGNAETRLVSSVPENAKGCAIVFGATMAVLMGFSSITTAHDLTLGSEGTGSFTCDASADWDTVRSVVLSSSPHAHNCVINASADLDNPGGDTADQQYHITVSMDSVNPLLDNSAARTVELRDQSGVNDPNVWPVSTTSRVVASANTSHTFRLQCRKNSGANPNLTIFDSGLTVVCLQQ